jgi:hypothetical protein
MSEHKIQWLNRPVDLQIYQWPKAAVTTKGNAG